MNTCGNCKFKGDPIMTWINDYEDEVSSGYFACQRVKHEKLSTDIASGQGAFVKDGSGYYAALCVEDDFACNRWEEK